MSHGFQHPSKAPQSYVPQIDDNNTEDSSNQYENNPHQPYANAQPYPSGVVQQGIVYQGVPNPNYAPSYPNQQLPHMHPQAYPAANYPIPGQNPIAAPETQAFVIETRIHSGFCCYTCLVYTGLIFAIFGALFAFLNLGEMFINFAFSAFSIWVYISALNAKSNLNTKKQRLVFILFCVMTGIKLIGSIIGIHEATQQIEEEMPHTFENNHDSPYENRRLVDPKAFTEALEDSMLFGVLIDFVLNLILVFNARKLAKMMKERDLLLNLRTPNIA